jgi:hypothetical protein
MSSTSEDVCELWTGKGIARIKGKRPAGMEPLTIDYKTGEVMDISTALGTPKHHFELDESVRTYSEAERRPSYIQKVADGTPNLSLDMQDPRRDALISRCLALGSMAAQLGVTVANGIIAYRLKWAGSQPTFAYLCYLVGEVLMCGSVMGCSHAIETTTKEWYLRCKKDHISVVRLQQACTVGDQHFPSSAVFNPFEHPNIYISRRVENIPEHRRYVHPCGSCVDPRLSFGMLTSLAQYFCWVCAVLSVIGICLFIAGSRALHWTGLLLHVVVSVIGIVLRMLARTRLSRNPPSFAVEKRNEIPWLALGVCHTRNVPSEGGEGVPGETSRQTRWDEYFRKTIRWEVATGEFICEDVKPPNMTLTKPLSTSLRRVPMDAFIDTSPSEPTTPAPDPATPAPDPPTPPSEPTMPASKSVSPCGAHMQAFKSIASIAPQLVQPMVTKSASELVAAIEGVANYFKSMPDCVAWKGVPPFQAPSPVSSASSSVSVSPAPSESSASPASSESSSQGLEVTWQLPIIYQVDIDIDKVANTSKSVSDTSRSEPAKDASVLASARDTNVEDLEFALKLDASHFLEWTWIMPKDVQVDIQGALSFWLHILYRRDSPREAKKLDAVTPFSFPRPFYRIVGSGLEHAGQPGLEHVALLERWIGRMICLLTMNGDGGLSQQKPGFPEDNGPRCFGMSLSHLSR